MRISIYTTDLHQYADGGECKVNLHVVITGSRPSVVLISSVNQVRCENRFRQSASGHESKEEWMIVSLDIGHVGLGGWGAESHIKGKCSCCQSEQDEELCLIHSADVGS